MREYRLAVAVCALIASCIATILALVFLSIWVAGLVTAGPHQSARNNLYQECSQRFEVGVYDEPCLSIVRSKR
jgi:hypothetical protein